MRDDLRSVRGDVTPLPGLVVADNDWNSTATASGRLLRSSERISKIGNDSIPHERMTNSSIGGVALCYLKSQALHCLCACGISGDAVSKHSSAVT